jgi:hypothetical protein
MCHNGHSIAKLDEEKIFQELETTSCMTTPEKITSEIDEVNSAQPLSKSSISKDDILPTDVGLGLFNYLESYRKRLGQMKQLDTLAVKQGRTLDLSSGSNMKAIKRTRAPTDLSNRVKRERQPTERGVKKEDELGSLKYAYPQSVLDYAKLIANLR